ncbi:unnamed protein product, partial [Pylaiella littoralis]
KTSGYLADRLGCRAAPCTPQMAVRQQANSCAFPLLPLPRSSSRWYTSVQYFAQQASSSSTGVYCYRSGSRKFPAPSHKQNFYSATAIPSSFSVTPSGSPTADAVTTQARPSPTRESSTAFTTSTGTTGTAAAAAAAAAPAAAAELDTTRTMAESSSDKASTASSGWSDEEGDEYLAKALASDDYLQGSRGGSASSSPFSSSTAAIGAGQAQHGPATGTASTSSTDTTAGKARMTILIHHPLCELHDIPDHPERPGRVRAIMNALTRNFPDIGTALAPEATVEQVLRFHDKAHVDNILGLCSKSEKRGGIAAAAAARDNDKGGGGSGKRSASRDGGDGGSGGGGRRTAADSRHAGIVQIDPDTAVMPASRGAIFRAAGAACFAVDEVMSGRATNAFCCVRPPGHHAEPDRAMGFCFFNNAPIGALQAKAVHGTERVAVVDIDVHHGNGTQAFFKADPTTFYASTHQGPRFYPCTGFDDITGVANNIVNVSMGSGEGSSEFRKGYSEKILPALEAFRPGLIVISAGFDAHVDDPLAGITLDEEDYRWVTQEICTVAERVCGGRVVSILEGGYNLQAISGSAVAHVHALRQAAAATPTPATPSETPAATTTAAAAAAAAAATARTEETGLAEASPPPPPSSETTAATSTSAAAAATKTTEENGRAEPLPSGPPEASRLAAVAGARTAEPLTKGRPTADGEGKGESEGTECGTPGALRAEQQEDIDLMLAQLSIQDAGDTPGQEG